MKEIYRYIYKITCTQGTWKNYFYFGQHTTKNLNDGYKGCGTKLRCYYKKYPEDFIKEIISFHNTQEELNEAEYDIIHPYLNDPMCLNISEGGWGGSHPAWNKGMSPSQESKIKMSKGQKKRFEDINQRENARIKSLGNHNVENFWKTHKGYFSGKSNPMYGKNVKDHMSKESYDLMRKHLSESLNGKKYLTDGILNVYVKPEYWGEFIDIGFTFVRKLYYKKKK